MPRKTKPKPKPGTKAKTTKPSKYKYANEIDYVHTDKDFGPIEIRKTANGWWGSQFNGGVKVAQIVHAYRMDFSGLQACLYAGITKDQLDHFRDVHPHFNSLIPILRESVSLKAKNNLVRKIADSKVIDVETSKWWLERKCRGEFATKNETRHSIGSDIEDLDEDQLEKSARAALDALQAKQALRKELNGK